MEDQLQCMEFTVTEDMEEERIDKLLSSLMDSFSRSYIQKLLTGGNLLINDKTIGKVSYKVKAEDEVKLFVPPAEQLNIEPEDVTMAATFVDDLGADSLDIFQIIMGIEEEFDIEIPNEAAEQIVTVGDAVEQIKNALN